MKMPPEHEAKFRKVLGLLGSDQDGERASAAKIATAYLKQYRMTWADVGDAFFARPAATPHTMGPSPYNNPDTSYMARESELRREAEAAKSRERQAREDLKREKEKRRPRDFAPVEDHKSKALDLLQNWTDSITEWEVGFLRSIRRRDALTRKQAAVLDKIYDRVSSEASSWRA